MYLALRSMAATAMLAWLPEIAAAQTDATARQGVVTAPGGRYAFGQISALSRDQYMLDTQTGRLWQLVCVKLHTEDKSKCVMTELSPISYQRPSPSQSEDLLPPPPPAPPTPLPEYGSRANKSKN